MQCVRPAIGRTSLADCEHASGLGWPEETDRRLGAATSRVSQSGQRCIAPYMVGLRQRARRALLRARIRGPQVCLLSSPVHGTQSIADGELDGCRRGSTRPPGTFDGLATNWSGAGSTGRAFGKLRTG